VKRLVGIRTLYNIYISEKSIFLAPNLYISNTNNGEICKMKGFKFNKDQLKIFFTFEELEHLRLKITRLYFHKINGKEI